MEHKMRTRKGNATLVGIIAVLAISLFIYASWSTIFIAVGGLLVLFIALAMYLGKKKDKELDAEVEKRVDADTQPLVKAVIKWGLVDGKGCPKKVPTTKVELLS